jgi:hypothetical protein
MMNDIDASDTATWNDAGTSTTDVLEGFRPIGMFSYPTPIGGTPFLGVFEGNGKKISGLTINRPDTDNVGLFRGMGEGGNIQNLILEGGTVTGRDNVGGVVGGGGSSIISNCSLSCSVVGKNKVGGLMGSNIFCSVSNCSTFGSVTGTSGVGGLIGFNESTDITSCTTSGAVTTQAPSSGGSAGGLIGSKHGGDITSCSVTGTVTNNGGSSTGGLIGSASGNGDRIISCFVSGAVTSTGDGNTGGLIGSNSNQILSCVVTGSVTATGSRLYAGGLIGSNNGKITSCSTTGALTATGVSDGAVLYAGGLVGYHESWLINSFATGAVTATVTAQRGSYLYAGGLMGFNRGSRVTGNFATGNVISSCLYSTEQQSAGGLVGENAGPLQNCYATSGVKQDGGSVSLVSTGGLVGNNLNSIASIANCYATGAVASSGTAGGLVGRDGGSIKNSFATGAVSGDHSAVGGLIGFHCGTTVTACYWDVETTSQTVSAGGAGAVGKTTVEMKHRATFQPGGGAGAIDWDFTNVWGIVEGESYPYLRAFESASPQFRLNVLIQGNGSVALSPPGGVYAPGTTVTLTAMPDAGYRSLGWTGPVADWTTSSTTLVVTGDTTVTARFGRIYEIRTLAELQAVASGDLEGYYLLMNDLDASATATWNDAGTDTSVLEGFRPIGTYSDSTPDTTSFRGVFDGNGKKITGLTINRPKVNYHGLFGMIGKYGKVQNLTLENGRVSVKEKSAGGILAGGSNGQIVHCSATGWISHAGGARDFATGPTVAGGLVGSNRPSGILTDCSTSVTVFSPATGRITVVPYLGGLVGTNSGQLVRCSASGPVRGRLAGGLVGYNTGSVERCFATGTVTGIKGLGGPESDESQCGGLISNNLGRVTGSFATGLVVTNGNGEDYVMSGGLIGHCWQDARIQSCYATGAVTGTADHAGGLIGDCMGQSVISNCFSTGAVTAEASRLGGLIGYCMESPRIMNCYATGSVAGATSSLGGLIGSGGLIGVCSEGSQITNCYAVGPVAGTAGNAGGLIASCRGTVTACYWDVETTGQTTSAGGAGGGGKTTAEMKQQATFQPGGGTETIDWDFTSIWGIAEGQSYPYLQALSSQPLSFPLSVLVAGSGSVTLDPPGGVYAPGSTVRLTAVPAAGYHFVTWTGAVADREALSTTIVLSSPQSVLAYFRPHSEIRTLAELQAVNTRDPERDYTVMNDIDASATAGWNDEGTTAGLLEGFRPLGAWSSPDTTSFRGVFNGNGKKIIGLTINRPGVNYVGLFVSIGKGGVVKNLVLEGGSVTGKKEVGGVAGYNMGTVQGGSISIAVTGNEDVGGVVGGNSGVGVVTGLTQAGTVRGLINAGGLVGKNGRGGDIGSVGGLVSNNRVTGIVMGETDSVCTGGGVGYNFGTVRDCSIAGKVTGTTSVGGTVGSNFGVLTGCVASGLTSGTENVGGVAGRTHGKIVACSDSGEVIGGLYVGGLAGYNSFSSTIADCFSTGPVSGSGGVGGLVGYNAYMLNSTTGARITNCFATGPVTGNGNVGGLVGSNYGSKASITNCFATGSVAGGRTVGGLVGYNYAGTLTNAYATGRVTGEGNVGGLLGSLDSGTVTACYWDKETTGQTTSSGSDATSGKTTAEMKQKATFQPGGGTGATDWDFTSVWGIFEGQTYPFLRTVAPLYRLTVTVEGEGAVVQNPVGEFFRSGSEITLTARSNAGARFVRWTGDVPAGGVGQNPLKFAIRGDTSLKAGFETGSHPAVWMVR